MKWFLILAALAALSALALQAYLRLYPHDFARFHRDRPVPEGGDALRALSTGVTVSLGREDPPDAVLRRIDAVIRAAPRTRVIAGSVEEGRITYLTRTAFWGFPDLTHVQATPETGGTRLLVTARQWLGGYDWDVNRDRVTGWLKDAGLPIPPEDTTSP